MMLKVIYLTVYAVLIGVGGQLMPTAYAQDACIDDLDFMFKNDPKKNCNWVGRAAKNRCGRKSNGVKIHTFCPDACGKCPNDNDSNESCFDDPKFKYNNDKKKKCNWVGLKPEKRCSKTWKGIELSAYCPQMCNACPEEEPTSCEDDKNLQFRENPQRNCDWVAKNTKMRCKKTWKGKKLKKHCPMTCDACPDSPPIPDPDTGGDSEDACCSLDFKHCIGWCGPTKDSCLNCNHHDGVGWLKDGPPQDKCKSRWKGCQNSPNSCCPGLTCREDPNDYLMCLPELPSTTAPTLSPIGSPSASPTFPKSPTESPSASPTVSQFPSGSPTTSPTSSPTESSYPSSIPTAMDTTPSNSPSIRATGQPTNGPSDSPINAPSPAGACCTLDFETCIDWCGPTKDSCLNCNHHDGVHWLENGPPKEQCLRRWTGCENDFNGCCDGMTCREDDNNFLMCLPLQSSSTMVPTKSPTGPPTSPSTHRPTQSVSEAISPSNPPSSSPSASQNTASPTTLPTPLATTGSPESHSTASPSNSPTVLPSSKPSNSPQAQVSFSPTNIPQQNSNGCCSLDYKICIDWCGSDYDSCMNCSNPDVAWLPNGAPNSQCGERWTGCDHNNDTGHNGCCSGLSCQWRSESNYFACLPNLDPTSAPVPPPPTDAPTNSPTVPIEPTISPAPTAEPSLLRTDKAMNTWDIYLGLDYITHKNSVNPPNYALVASGGAAGSGNLVVSESQAYGLLITGTVLASWNTHAGRVPNSRRSDVLDSFEGYFNFWIEMSKNSSNKGSNCQPGGDYCKSSSGSKYVCLPDWRHYKTGGSESTGPAPDADEDAIVGIILAVKAVENDTNKPSWYETARKWADASATAFFEFEVDKSRSNHRLVKLGSCWGGWEGEGNNPSYHSPGSFRVMKDYQKSFSNSDRDGYSGIPEEEWNKLIATSHEVLRAVQCSNGGALVPNWATIGEDSSGNIIHSGGGFSGSGTPQYEYGAEAARTTFRVALDAAFYPEMSGDWSPYLSNFYGRMDGNFQNGSFSSATFPSCRGPNTGQNINMFGDWQSNAFIYGPTYSSLIAASSDITNANAMVDVAGEILGATPLPSSYYPRSWAMISNLMLNGAMESAGYTLKN